MIMESVRMMMHYSNSTWWLRARSVDSNPMEYLKQTANSNGYLFQWNEIIFAFGRIYFFKNSNGLKYFEVKKWDSNGLENRGSDQNIPKLWNDHFKNHNNNFLVEN